MHYFLRNDMKGGPFMRTAPSRSDDMPVHPDYLGTEHGEGYVGIDDYELFYRRWGHGDETVLGLHGGPGMPHDYLVPLSQHAGDDRTLLLYDQFGVGRSDRPAPGDFDRYTVEHYRDEVEAVRQSLVDGPVTIYGQSWGGMLAIEYALEYGEHIDRLILANTLADTASAFESMRSVLDELPEEDQRTIEKHEGAREFDAQAYEDALDGAYRDHVCRTGEYPDPVLHTFENINPDVYGLMWGPNEYVLMETARLRGWDVRGRLHEIDIPTLVLTGSHDEISPDIAAGIADRIPDSELVEFDESSHMPFWEQPDSHYEVLESFLSE